MRFSVLLLCLVHCGLFAAVPGIISYQGRVSVGANAFTGTTGQFKFALVNAAGTTTFWSNDGTSTAGSQPTAAVSLSVNNGLYAVLLGDSSIAGMTQAIPASVFDNSDVRLRVWFNDGTNGVQQLAPDQRIVAVGYALVATNVRGGTVAGTSGSISDNSAGTAFYVSQAGTGATIHGQTNGTGVGGFFENTNAANSNTTLVATSNGTGRTAHFLSTNTSAANSEAALFVDNFGSGAGAVALRLNVAGNTPNIALFETASTAKARIDKNGTGFFNGGTQTSGADIAELFEVEGDRKDYQPGDVLVLSTKADRHVLKSSEPYSKLVSGVHATKPGVLLTEGDASNDDHSSKVPMGVLGVIPTKVCAENGPIRIGDLLVTSSRYGHAMKGTDTSRMMGATIGKAMQNFDGSGSGMINVLVNTK